MADGFSYLCLLRSLWTIGRNSLSHYLLHESWPTRVLGMPNSVTRNRMIGSCWSQILKLENGHWSNFHARRLAVTVSCRNHSMALIGWFPIQIQTLQLRKFTSCQRELHECIRIECADAQLNFLLIIIGMVDDAEVLEALLSG